MLTNSDMHDVIVIGGGPAALSHALQYASSSCRTLIVSDKFGGCMEMMGDLRMQSYIPELTIASAPVDLQEFLSNKAESRPTGREYAQYIDACFSQLATRRLFRTVRSIGKSNGTFELRVGPASGAPGGVGDGEKLYAKKLVLATGIRPRPPVRIPGASNLTCFEAYRLIADNELEPFSGKNVCIVGSGNTAYQLAYALARAAKTVTLMATKYLGFYSVENLNNFALRAPSLQTIELIEKTAATVSHVGPLNVANVKLASMYLMIYDKLSVDDDAKRMQARLPLKSNEDPLIRKSMEAARRAGYLRPADTGFATWSMGLEDLVVISAIGIEANIPESPWPDLLDKSTGFIKHQDGKTSVDGLYVTGCAAGYPSVNYMRPVAAVF